MAITLKKTVSFALGAVVDSAVDAVRSLRTTERARKEAAFQSAIADGMEYSEQIKFREEQLAEERSSGFIDDEYVGKLTGSIGDLKRLKRFNDYRTKYSQALGELNDGQINAIDYRRQLQGLLSGTEDPELREEIEGNIASADAEVTRYRDTLLGNQIKKAQYDGTTKILSKTIKDVKAARARAALGDNEDEVAEYDATLSALTSQLTQAKVEDVVNDITVAGAVGTFGSKTKLDTINSQLDDADDNVPVTIGGKRYNSEREYWEVTRGAYLSGTGTGIFSDYFGELSSQYKERIDGATARFGFVPADTINGIKGEFDNMLTRPEFAPYAEQLQGLGAQAVAAAANTMANTIVDRAVYSGDFRAADQALKALASTYGIDTSAYQLQLGNNLNQQVNATISAGGDPGDVADILPSTDFATPTATPSTPVVPAGSAPSSTLEILKADNGKMYARDTAVAGSTFQEYTGPVPAAAAPTPAPTPRANPAPTPTPTPKVTPAPAPVAPVAPVKPMTPAPAAGGMYSVKAGDTLGAIAKARGTTVADIIKKNPGITDPNKIKVGQGINF